jgi:hypothetical protein
MISNLSLNKNSVVILLKSLKSIINHDCFKIFV